MSEASERKAEMTAQGLQYQDDDYDYYWSMGGIDMPIPESLAEMLDVPLVVRWELFLIGVCAGLAIAAIAFLIAFASAT